MGGLAPCKLTKMAPHGRIGTPWVDWHPMGGLVPCKLTKLAPHGRIGTLQVNKIGIYPMGGLAPHGRIGTLQVNKIGTPWEDWYPMGGLAHCKLTKLVPHGRIGTHQMGPHAPEDHKITYMYIAAI